ncbi:MAG: hypothetical protein ACR2NB_04115 [Solirubrobacteraceae bacterium]
MKPVDLSHLTTRRGPIAYRFNGRGSKPWLPQTTCDPGWVSLAGHPPRRRLCWRCAVQVSAIGEGKVPLFWEEGPPAADDRCARCLRGYGTRSEASADG